MYDMNRPTGSTQYLISHSLLGSKELKIRFAIVLIKCNRIHPKMCEEIT